MDNKNAISLFELNANIKAGVKKILPGTYWTIAEISELNINQSGHCYLELIEKATDSEQITAKAKATIWAFTFRMLKPYFESVTGQRFTTGIKVMLAVTVEFHELYGFSLNVKDIEPNFTIGDLSRKKQQIIKQLQDEGVFHLNKELELPLVPQTIAIISSETAAGYGDFINQLTNNHYGFKFYTQLFKAFMQGADTEKSIINALERIFSSKRNFDIVVIIRGGGSQADLNYFNSYWLAYHITQFPIPIITGIGHERDETICDMVAHTNLKTPTAVAEFIIDKTLEFESYLSGLQEAVIDNVTNKLRDFNDDIYDIKHQLTSKVSAIISNYKRIIDKNETIFKLGIRNKIQNKKQNIQNIAFKIHPKIRHLIQIQKKNFDILLKDINTTPKRILQTEYQRITEFENKSHILDPINLLKKGYSLTFNNGVLIKSAQNLKHGDIITSKWIDGSVKSVVEKIPENNT